MNKKILLTILLLCLFLMTGCFKKKFTVTFDSNGGTTVEDIKVEKDSRIALPNSPIKEGYTFKGWYYGEELWSFASFTVVNDLTLVARWDINQYTITFNTNGGNLIKPITQDFGTIINSPQDPYKLGFVFNGWDQEIPNTMPAHDLTINAKWIEMNLENSFRIFMDKLENNKNNIRIELRSYDRSSITIKTDDDILYYSIYHPMTESYTEWYVYDNGKNLNIYKYENKLWTITKENRRKINLLSVVYINDINEFELINNYFCMKQEYINQYNIKSLKLSFDNYNDTGKIILEYPGSTNNYNIQIASIGDNELILPDIN